MYVSVSDLNPSPLPWWICKLLKKEKNRVLILFSNLRSRRCVACSGWAPPARRRPAPGARGPGPERGVCRVSIAWPAPLEPSSWSLASPVFSECKVELECLLKANVCSALQIVFNQTKFSILEFPVGSEIFFYARISAHLFAQGEFFSQIVKKPQKHLVCSSSEHGKLLLVLFHCRLIDQTHHIN